MKTSKHPDSSRARGGNGGAGCRICRGHEGTIDDIGGGTGTVPAGFSTGQLSSSTELASLGRATEWLNSPPLTPADLRGKVVLIDFWTYTCINWLRTLPYVRAWAEKYREQGLVVIGVHAPEFAFEKDLDNVRWAVKDMRIDYPVAVDNDHADLARFQQPVLAGAVLHRCAGACSTSPFRRGLLRTVRNDASGAAAEAGAARGQPRPGPGRCAWPRSCRRLGATSISGKLSRLSTAAENFASPGGAVLDTPRIYEVPARLRLNEWALSGDWTVKKENTPS